MRHRQHESFSYTRSSERSISDAWAAVAVVLVGGVLLLVSKILDFVVAATPLLLTLVYVLGGVATLGIIAAVSVVIIDRRRQPLSYSERRIREVRENRIRHPIAIDDDVSVEIEVDGRPMIQYTRARVLPAKTNDE